VTHSVARPIETATQTVWRRQCTTTPGFVRHGTDFARGTFGGVNVLDPSPIASIIALVIALAAGVGVLWVWLSTAPSRVRAGAATMDSRSIISSGISTLSS